MSKIRQIRDDDLPILSAPWPSRWAARARGRGRVRPRRHRLLHLLPRPSAGAAHQARRHGQDQHARRVQRRVLAHRQDPDVQARPVGGQSADRPLLHRRRRARRHARGPDRRHQPEPRFRLGSLDPVLRRAGTRVQDRDDHRPGARQAVHLEARRRAQRRHPRPAEQQDRQGRGPAQTVLRHHRHGASRARNAGAR